MNFRFKAAFLPNRKAKGLQLITTGPDFHNLSLCFHRNLDSILELYNIGSFVLAELVFGSLELTRNVMDTYTQAAFFTRRKVSEDK